MPKLNLCTDAFILILYSTIYCFYCKYYNYNVYKLYINERRYYKRKHEIHIFKILFLFNFLFYLDIGSIFYFVLYLFYKTSLRSAGNFILQQFRTFPGQKEKHVASTNIVTALKNFESTYQHVQVEVGSNVFSQYANILEIESHFEKVYRI